MMSARTAIGPRAHGKLNVVSALSTFGIVATAVGVGATYVDFVTSVAAAAVPGVTPVIAAAALFPVVLLFTVLGRLDILAYTSALGNVAVAAGIVAVIVDGATTPAGVGVRPAFEPVEIARPVGAASFVGSTSFLFAIHIIALPVIEGIALSRRRVAVNAAFAVVTLLNLSFAVAAVVLFGAGVSSNVVDDVGSGPALLVAKGLLVLDLAATMPVVLLAAVRVIERALRLSARPARASYMLALFVRTACVSVAFGIAFAVPDFGQLVSVVGGVVSCLMGFVLPPLLHAAVRHAHKSMGLLDWAGTVVISGCGLAAMVITLIQTLGG
ncbi:hypothetical protein FNF28_03017 [Cafeteria roenbergensis]|uniref:Amino acid transporter transmembrane domain-containing protein n=1 Tax=Cafeteria roenbergensis TaxID=33653 RepID=A0A5A8DNC9_CAFRO|nr:hypothetical protein FNF28_03017 [Cafeteria roenbergensis]